MTSVYDPTKSVYEEPMGSCWPTQDSEEGEDQEEDVSPDEAEEDTDTEEETIVE